MCVSQENMHVFMTTIHVQNIGRHTQQKINQDTWRLYRAIKTLENPKWESE